MESIGKNYDHRQSQERWYSHWLQQKYFSSTPDDRQPYTVVIPPPNVTGVLHMGHCLNNTIQDILVRRARQDGYNACWVPGTDHASIATEAKVVQMLRERGIAKGSLSREEFLAYAWEWKEKYGGIILQQLKQLGCSLDWDRVNFTMDPDYYKAVIQVFNTLYKKGLIYRGKRMINWDPAARTALSDEEVIFRDTQSKLYHLQYPVANETGDTTGEYITIATVRPETILGDTAIAVHPEDERYRHLVGKFALVPLINRRVPIIADEYVEKDFGTGALKITPAHDPNDNIIGEKHGLEVVDIMEDDGTFSEAAQLFIGEDRFEARKKIIPLLQEQGFLTKTEDYPNQVGYSERSNAVVEPRLSLQWWVKMPGLAAPALDVVNNGEIEFHPAKFVNLYRHWMENVKDWCISRQLWWGHRIPAWYDLNGNVFVAESEQGARLQAARKYFEAENVKWDDDAIFNRAQEIELTQDEDCLDTWFSSWLWPFEVFKGLTHPGNKDVAYYYPTATLVTAPEIIFFWVARMIMAGMEFKGEIPFRDVYFTGIVRDEIGRKMSKQLGNSPDLLELIDRYGADAVRFGIMIASPAGNDLMFDVKEESTLKQGSFFINKMWNALRLLKMWEENTNEEKEPVAAWANEWMEARLESVSRETAALLSQFRLSEALKSLYGVIWNDFCSWYLEWLKPAQGKALSKEQINQAKSVFERLMQLLHPFMPFITEEIHHLLGEKAENDDLTIKPLPKLKEATDEPAIIAQGQLLQALITSIRDTRNKLQLSPREPVTIHVQTPEKDTYEAIIPLWKRQSNAEIEFTENAIEGATLINIEGTRVFVTSHKAVDTAAQKEELQKELEYQKKFYQSVEKKLSNERFVQNAPEAVVALERKKLADCETRIRTIEESLQLLKN